MELYCQIDKWKTVLHSIAFLFTSHPFPVLFCPVHLMFKNETFEIPFFLGFSLCRFSINPFANVCALSWWKVPNIIAEKKGKNRFRRQWKKKMKCYWKGLSNQQSKFNRNEMATQKKIYTKYVMKMKSIKSST